ncbi:MAG: hypothetical protein PF692_08960 [Kiritimatiellae bacterium]|nr:hypothetical protein [Kiritimatiellia bacterium]
MNGKNHIKLFNRGRFWLLLAIALELLVIVGTCLNIFITHNWTSIIGWLGRIACVLVPLLLAYHGKFVALWIAVFFFSMTGLAGVIFIWNAKDLYCLIFNNIVF